MFSRFCCVSLELVVALYLVLTTGISYLHSIGPSEFIELVLLLVRWYFIENERSPKGVTAFVGRYR